LFHERRPASNQEARRLLQQSLQRDPQLDWAFYLGGLTHQQDIVNQWSSSPQASVKSLNELSVEFERKHPIDPRAQLVRAYALLYLGQREAAHDRLLQSLESAPNQHLSYLLLGQTLAMADSPDPAIEQYEIATRLSPRDCDLWSIRTATALTHFVAERLEQALIWAESALQLRPDLAFTFGTVASISALCGDLPKAKQALSSMLNINPNMTIERFAPVLASTHPGIAQRYLRGLKLAGLA
jgi:tetratricopeptide (TPR) repeat protein